MTYYVSSGTLNSTNSTLITHADSIHGIKATVCACVCVCVRTIKPKRLKQTCHRDSPSWILAIHIILGQKVKVTKCKNILKLIEWLAWVYTLLSGQHLVLFLKSVPTGYCYGLLQCYRLNDNGIVMISCLLLIMLNVKLLVVTHTCQSVSLTRFDDNRWPFRFFLSIVFCFLTFLSALNTWNSSINWWQCLLNLPRCPS